MCATTEASASTKENNMADGRHPTRFIVEVFDEIDGKWNRSRNLGIDGFFKTREEATEAMNKYKSEGMKYRVRMK
jgi:hypothetical protein